LDNFHYVYQAIIKNANSKTSADIEDFFAA